MSNDDVYHKIHKMKSIKKKRKKWVGHPLSNNEWVTYINEGKVKATGKRKSRQSYMKQIRLDLGKGSYKKLKEAAMDREEWRNISLMNQFKDIKTNKPKMF